MKRSVLVTGGAGFMGSHVARYLADGDHTVVVYDDLSGGSLDNVDHGCTFVEGSITDHHLLADLFEKHRFEYVFHLAAYAAEGLSHFIKRFNYVNNVVGSVNLINESVKHDVKCFVFTSSIAVYGTNQLPMHEDLDPVPEDSYGIAKLCVERELEVSRKMFGLNSITFRPHNVYGEHQNIGDRYRNVVGIFMNRLMSNEPMSVFGDGEQTRAFTYIGDVAGLIADSVKNSKAYNQVLNVGTNQVCSVNDLTKAVAHAMQKPADVVHLDARDEVKHAYSDHSKVEQIFGPQSYTSLEKGLSRMAAWAKRVGVRSSKRFEGIEIVKNLPPSWRDEVLV